ncbi:hypothetical protein [uncultured Helicobacter sp.]|uniref:hypothetical protein n=1 Tax=uncultured Helicobacter sp. TaxID=175537 RepID=UPI00374FC521
MSEMRELIESKPIGVIESSESKLMDWGNMCNMCAPRFNTRFSNGGVRVDHPTQARVICHRQLY